MLLSKISLTLLQTAFHASFREAKDADEKSLKISRGTSVVSDVAKLVAFRSD